VWQGSILGQKAFIPQLLFGNVLWVRQWEIFIPDRNNIDKGDEYKVDKSADDKDDVEISQSNGTSKGVGALRNFDK
jgi:hypothetical protein